MMYRVGRLLWSRFFALIGALMIAVLFLPVQLSHFIYPDSPLLFAMLMAYFFILKVVIKARLQDFLLAGVAISCAVSFKYNAALLMVPYGIAFFLCQKRHLSYLFLSFLVMGITCFVLNPFFFIDFKFALQELQEQSAATGVIGWWHHLNYSLKQGLGLPLFVFFLLSLVLGLIHLSQARYRLVFYGAVLAFYLHLVFFAQPYGRYGILLIPLACWFSVEILQSGFRQWGKAWMGGAIALVLLLLLIVPLIQSVTLDQVLSQKDTRELAAEWITTKLPRGSSLFLDHPRFQPHLSRCPEELRSRMQLAQPGSPQARRIETLIQIQSKDSPCFKVFYPEPASGEQPSDFLLSGDFLPLDWKQFQKKGIQYFSISRLGPNHPEKRILDFIDQHGELLVRFSPYKDPRQAASLDSIDLTGAPTTLQDLRSRERNGHIIEIYKLSSSS